MDMFATNRALSPFIIHDAWESVYYGREVTSEYDKYFSPINGAYPETGSGTIRLNLKASISSDRKIVGISYYKVKDTSANYFMRPVTHDMPLTKTDIKKFSSLLDLCTLDRAEGVLQKLLVDANVHTLPNGWKMKKTTKKALSMSDGIDQVVIPIRVVKRAIDLSFSYIDVLSLETVWQANPDILPPEYASALIALFSLIDYSNYPNLEELRKESDSRIAAYERIVGYYQLREAVMNNDEHAVCTYAKYADTTTPGNEIPLLFIAIEHKSIDILKQLLINGADVNEAGPDRHDNYGRITPVSYTIIHGLDDLFQIIIQNKQMPSNDGCQKALWMKRLDLLEQLLANGEQLFYCTSDPEMLSPNMLCRFSKYTSIEWMSSEIITVYEAGERDAALSMIRAWKTAKEHFSIEDMMMYLIEHEDYEAACECISEKLHDAWNKIPRVQNAMLKAVQYKNPKWGTLIKAFWAPFVIDTAIFHFKRSATTDSTIPLEQLIAMYGGVKSEAYDQS